ncbi:3446_t:CDS:1, partial [Funneliformis mosseae]
MLQRRQNQRRQQHFIRINRVIIYQSNSQRRVQPINNQDMLSRIAILPQQTMDNNPMLEQFFNG